MCLWGLTILICLTKLEVLATPTFSEVHCNEDAIVSLSQMPFCIEEYNTSEAIAMEYMESKY